MDASLALAQDRHGARQALSWRVWLTYVGAFVLAWMLYVMAGSELERGLDSFWLAAYQASFDLVPLALVAAWVLPWVRRLHASSLGAALQWPLHGVAAVLLAALWQGLEFGLGALLFGADHAGAVLMQSWGWRSVWAIVVYGAIATAFTATLQARRARQAAVAAAQAESALARAELSAISGKLNPHFLFNTLNSLIALTRKDAAQAESHLLRFSTMLRYVLDTKRGADGRVALSDEIAFLRDYLALEALRLGSRLRVDWRIDDAVLNDELPPLTLQPLVENSIQHGVAPSKSGGSVLISAQRNVLNRGLDLCIADDGPGCEPSVLEPAAEPGQRRGIGLAALRKRFSLDYDGQARLRIHTAPGAGFRVDLWIPQS